MNADEWKKQYQKAYNIAKADYIIKAFNMIGCDAFNVGSIDLTDAVGEINSVQVQPNDKILIKLFRDNASETSGATEEAKLLMDSFQINF